MTTIRPQRFLIADDNPIFRETLVQALRAGGHEVVSPETGVDAFLALRDRSRPVAWLYARAVLPGLIDGWILADEYHDTYPTRPAVIGALEARPFHRGNIVLRRPSPKAVLKIIRQLITASHHLPTAAGIGPSGQRRAA